MNPVTKSEQIDLSREPSFRLGAVEFRPATREAVSGDIREMLEPRVMQVLVVFSRRRGQVVSRDELVLSCWAGRIVSDDAINRSISRVRAVAETLGGFALETVPRVGYRLTEIDPAPQSLISNAVRAPIAELPIRRTRWWPFLATAMAALVIVMVGVAYWALRTPGPTATTAKFTVAVLPFSPPPADRDSEQLGYVVATTIADALTHEGVDVISPANAGQFHGVSKAEAARALNADFLIDGEVVREGNQIKVPVRIVDGASGAILVSDVVEASASDAASLPDLAVGPVLVSGWGFLPALDPSAPWNLRVIAASLKIIKRMGTRDETLYAHSLARRIAETTPDDPYAHYLHAISTALMVPRSALDQRKALVLEARDAARKTLHLDPNFGEAYRALAEVTPTYNWSDREKHLRHGLRLRGTSPLTYMSLLALRMNAGYLRSGAVQAENAYSNHPLADNTMDEAIKARLWLGDPGAARLLLADAMKRYPKSAEFPARLFEATAFYEAFDEADALLKSPAAAPMLQPQGEGRTYSAILAALRHGRPADIKVVVNDCAKIQAHTREFLRTCFMALVKLGRLEDAFRMADKLYPDQRGTTPAEIERRWLAYMPFDTVYLSVPVTAPLRADPRYRDVVERVGLLRFWKERGTAPDFCAVEKVPLCADLKPL